MPKKESDPVGSINIAVDEDEIGENTSPDINISSTEYVPQQNIEEKKEEVQEEIITPGPSRRKLPSPWTSSIKFFLLCISIFFAIYSLAGFFIIPYGLKSYLPEVAATKLNRPVTVGSAQFNPYTLRLRINNTIVGPDLGDSEDLIDPLFSAASIEADLSLTSLFSWSLNLSRMSVDGLFLHVERDKDQKYNLQKIFPLQSTNKFPFLEIPFSYFIQNFSLSNGRVLLDDTLAQKNHELADISISLPLVFHSTDGKNAFPQNLTDGEGFIHPHFSALINGSPFELKGTTRLNDETFEARLQLHLDAIDLPSYLSYFPRRENLTIETGKADLAMEVIFVAANNKKPTLEIEAVCSMENVRLRDPKNNTNVFPLSKFSATFFPLTQRYIIKEIILKEPELHVSIDKKGVWHFLPTFSTLIDPVIDEDEKNHTSSGFNMESLTINKGKIFFTDQMRGGFVETLSNIEFTLTKPEEEQKELNFFFSALSSENNRTDSTGSVSFSPLQIEALVKCSKIGLHSLSHYLPLNNTLQIKQGTLTDVESSFMFTFDKKKAKSALVLGKTSAEISQLILGDQQKDWLQAPQAHIDFEKFNPDPGIFNTFHFQAQAPHIFLQWSKENSFNWNIALPYQFSEASVDLIAASVDIENLSLSSPLNLQMKDATVKASNLSTNFERKGNFSIEARLYQKEKQGNLTSHGSLTFSPFSAELQSKLTNFDITTAPGLLSEWLNVPVVSGTLEAEGALRLPLFTFNGTLSLGDFTVADGSGQMLSWHKAKSNNFALTTSPLRIVSPEIFITGSSFNWIATDSGDKKSGLLEASYLFAQKFKEDESPKEIFKIGRIHFDKGKLNYSDKRLKPFFVKNFEMTGSLANFTNNPTEQCIIDLALNEDRERTGKISGVITLFSDKLSADIDASFLKQQVREFSPYLQSLFGYRFTSGFFDFSTKYRLEQGKISAENSFLLSNIQFSKLNTSVDQFQLAYAIFEQDTKRIELDLPFRGDTSDSDYSFAAALSRSFRNLLLKTTVSPFSQLNSSFPAQETVADHLLFEPGTEKLSEQNKNQLILFSRILEKRPRLVVAIKGYAGYGPDQESLLKIKKEKDFQQKLLLEKQKPSQLTKSYGKEEINPILNGISEHIRANNPISVEKNELLQLAGKRQQAIYNFIISLGISPSRVLQDTPGSLVPLDAPGRPGNRVDFQLRAL